MKIVDYIKSWIKLFSIMMTLVLVVSSDEVVSSKLSKGETGSIYDKNVLCSRLPSVGRKIKFFCPKWY